MIFTLERTHYCFTKMAPEAVLSGIFFSLHPSRMPSKNLCSSFYQSASSFYSGFFSQYCRWFVWVRKWNRNETYELKKKKNKLVLHQQQKITTDFVAVYFELFSVSLFSLPFRLHYFREFIWTKTESFYGAGHPLDARQNRLEKDSSLWPFLRQTSTTARFACLKLQVKLGKSPGFLCSHSG